MSDAIESLICPNCDEKSIEKENDEVFCKHCEWDPLFEGFEIIKIDDPIYDTIFYPNCPDCYQTKLYIRKRVIECSDCHWAVELKED